ncbi:hypothetical protein QAD02_022016 [Eretmocerus hayati]|uniref:Uncharacterized protein n=1 Tax=Eretmocerus hayati TaxID=131215 RepID=A0ACC2PS47_9HYME|nr:hypothetical protein QAD02_022016 [Eretmocerus hayati]
MADQPNNLGTKLIMDGFVYNKSRSREGESEIVKSRIKRKAGEHPEEPPAWLLRTDLASVSEGVLCQLPEREALKKSLRRVRRRNLPPNPRALRELAELPERFLAADQHNIQNCAPTRILSDFEMAIINASKSMLPGVPNKCCFFHFGQALYRKIQSLGLQEEYCTRESTIRERESTHDHGP